MSEIAYIDEWSALHVIANLCIGMYTGAKHYNFLKTISVVTVIGIVWEIIEYISHESDEYWRDQATDMLLNTLGFTAGYVLGHELKK